MHGCPALKACKKGDIIQLTRRGFFKVDSAYEPASEFSGQPAPIVLYEIPDGHTKEKTTGAIPKKEAVSQGINVLVWWCVLLHVYFFFVF